MIQKKLKVGLFIDTFFPMIDGVISVVDNYARLLSKTCDVVVFAPKGRKKYNDGKLPYKVVRCSRLSIVGLDYDLPLPKLDSKFMKELKNSALDIVHIHSPFAIGKVGLSYAKKHNIPCVATMHSQFKQDFEKAVKSHVIVKALLKSVMKVFNECDECWSVNDNIGKIFVEYGAKNSPITHNNGTDFVPYENEGHLKELRDKYDIKNKEKVFLFVGRITLLKNVFFIVDSLAKLKEKGLPFKMLFVGGGQDEEDLKKTIKKLGLEKDVLMLGKIMDRNELSAHYALADLFLFPSLYDASSLVQIEAAAQKTPTIFIRGAATAGTVTEDKNGFLSDNSEEAFAQKIYDIFADEEYYQKVKQGAFNDLYVSWEKAVEEAKKQYIYLIEKGKKK